MLNIIKSYVTTTALFFEATVVYFKLKKYLREHQSTLFSFPATLNKGYDYHSKYYNRVQQYMHANHFFGEFLSLLRHRPLNDDERQRFAFLSACAPVFDDFFEQGKDRQEVRELMHQPSFENASTDSEKIAAYYFKQILEEVQNKEALLKAADSLFDAQVSSKSQSDELLSSDELLQISKEKGGFSGLMYALLFEKKETPCFYDLAFDLGSYGQLMDDIFDLYDDQKDGIRTFANQANNIHHIRLVIEEHETQILERLVDMDLGFRERKRFRNTLFVFSSIIEIALKQYEEIESQFQLSPQDCLNIDRKFWIVDMEKASKVWQLLRLSAQRIRA